MKKLLLLCFVLASCSIQPSLDMRDTEMEFSTLDMAGEWIRDNIEYKVTYPYNRQSPYQTEKNRYGHCADMTVLLLWYARELGYDVEYMSVTLNDGTNHALAVIAGVVIQAETYTVFNKDYYLKVNYVMELDDVLQVIQDDFGNRAIDTIQLD